MHGWRFAGKRAGLIVVFALLSAPPALAQTAATLPAGPDAAAAASGGMRVFIDPDTGQRSTTPPLAGASGAAAPLATGLVEEVNPRGGYVIDLKRRFRGEMAARVGADGSVAADCETGAATVRK